MQGLRGLPERAECFTPNIRALSSGEAMKNRGRQLGSPLKFAPAMLSVTVGTVVHATTPTMA